MAESRGERWVKWVRVEAGGIALIEVARPPVNALTPAVLEQLVTVLRRAQSAAGVKAIVVKGGAGVFSAGYDIKEFAGSGVAGVLASRHTVLDALGSLLEQGRRPTVAAIEGAATGGGLELAMACNARVCAVGSVLALPEVRLGIIPGLGGTQRLPRLVGVRAAADLMLHGQPVSPAAALHAGLVDVVVPDPSDLLPAALFLAKGLAAGWQPPLRSLEAQHRLEDPEEVAGIVAEARREAAASHPGQLHLQLCLDALEHGLLHGGEAGLEREGECLAQAAAQPLHAALVRAFLAYSAVKKARGFAHVAARLWAMVAAVRVVATVWWLRLRHAGMPGGVWGMSRRAVLSELVPG